MSKRYFDHLYNELSVAVGRRVSRYALWLTIWEAGGDPDALTRDDVRRLLDRHLEALLREEGTRLSAWKRRGLARRILQFDPHHPTPEEWLARTADALGQS